MNVRNFMFVLILFGVSVSNLVGKEDRQRNMPIGTDGFKRTLIRSLDHKLLTPKSLNRLDKRVLGGLMKPSKSYTPPVLSTDAKKESAYLDGFKQSFPKKNKVQEDSLHLLYYSPGLSHNRGIGVRDFNLNPTTAQEYPGMSSKGSAKAAGYLQRFATSARQGNGAGIGSVGWNERAEKAADFLRGYELGFSAGVRNGYARGNRLGMTTPFLPAYESRRTSQERKSDWDAGHSAGYKDGQEFAKFLAEETSMNEGSKHPKTPRYIPMPLSVDAVPDWSKPKGK